MNHNDIRQQQLIEWLGRATPFSIRSLEVVSGDASFRRYFRFFSDGVPYIAVDAPPETEDTRQFVDLAHAYKHQGVRVPRVLYVSETKGFYCIEDFGNTLFADKLQSGAVSQLYAKALRILPSIQACQSTLRDTLPAYDRKMVRFEMGIFTEWLLETHLKLPLTQGHKHMLEEVFNCLADNFLAQPQVGVHRDFHSRNLMFLEDGELGVIDFQGAVVGPYTYDAVSLLRDCYVRQPSSMVEEMMEMAFELAPSGHSLEQFKRWFDLTGIQRHLKASGIFARLYHRDGKRGYLADIPRTLQYIQSVAQCYPDTAPLGRFIEQDVLPGVSR